MEAEEECGCGETTSDGGCKIVQLPALKELSGAMLRAQDSRTIKAKQLWADNAALIFGVRRPGCGEWAAGMANGSNHALTWHAHG